MNPTFYVLSFLCSPRLLHNVQDRVSHWALLPVHGGGKSWQLWEKYSIPFSTYKGGMVWTARVALGGIGKDHSVMPKQGEKPRRLGHSLGGQLSSSLGQGWLVSSDEEDAH